MKDEILEVFFALQGLRDDSFFLKDKQLYEFACECQQKLEDILKEEDLYGALHELDLIRVLG